MVKLPGMSGCLVVGRCGGLQEGDIHHQTLRTIPPMPACAAAFRHSCRCWQGHPRPIPGFLSSCPCLHPLPALRTLQKSIVLTEAAGFTSVHSPFVYPGFGAYGPIYEEAEVPGACAVWLHITNQAKVRIEALPFKSALPPGYSWPLERIAAAAGGGATAGPQLGRQGRSAAEKVQLLGREGERAGRRGGSGRVGGGRRLQARQRYRG